MNSVRNPTKAHESLAKMLTPISLAKEAVLRNRLEQIKSENEAKGKVDGSVSERLNSLLRTKRSRNNPFMKTEEVLDLVDS